MKSNIEILEYIKNVNTNLSSIELCCDSFGKIRFAFKSFTINFLYELTNGNDQVVSILNTLPVNNCAPLEYGISFCDEVIKLYYVTDNMSVIGIDLVDGVINREKSYSVSKTGLIKVSECNNISKINNTTYYTKVNCTNEFSLIFAKDKFQVFNDSCDYSENLSKKQCYVRIYQNKFLKYYNDIIKLAA